MHKKLTSGRCEFPLDPLAPGGSFFVSNCDQAPKVAILTLSAWSSELSWNRRGVRCKARDSVLLERPMHFIYEPVSTSPAHALDIAHRDVIPGRGRGRASDERGHF